MVGLERKKSMVGLVRKALMVWLPSSALAYFVWGWRVAGGLLFGEALMLSNILFIAWLLRRGLGKKGRDQGTSGALGLAALFLVKLLVLFGLSYYVLAVIGLDPIGFVAGCMLSLVVLSWQVIAQSGDDGGSNEEEGADS